VHESDSRTGRRCEAAAPRRTRRRKARAVDEDDRSLMDQREVTTGRREYFRAICSRARTSRSARRRSKSPNVSWNTRTSLRSNALRRGPAQRRALALRYTLVRRRDYGSAGSTWTSCFPTTSTTRSTPPTCFRDCFVRSWKRQLCQEFAFHDLRHTAATLLLGQGEHPKIVQEMLGHSQASVTLDLYSHVTPGMHHNAADTFDRLLG
jgi:hypothetical protein